MRVEDSNRMVILCGRTQPTIGLRLVAAGPRTLADAYTHKQINAPKISLTWKVLGA